MGKGKIVVTGGCGYIGSHTIVDLIDNGYDVVSIDNLSRSDGKALEGIERITGKKVKNYQIDLINKKDVFETFKSIGEVAGIIHFAAYKAVGESVEEPLMYFENNLTSLVNVLSAIQQFEIKAFVFSSSCSVYGDVETLPVVESTPLSEAESPYARTKKIGEEVITDFAKLKLSRNVLLRYFNPVGAHRTALIGEKPIGRPSNLVPYMTQSAIGKLGPLTVFGDDYNTRDGSCIRDYIHVMDIAHAHTLALDYMLKGEMSEHVDVFNLGTGDGVSVLEMIASFEESTNQKLDYKIGPRREGDVVAVYANNSKAKNLLGWQTEYSLNDMMKTAWDWEKKLASC